MGFDDGMNLRMLLVSVRNGLLNIYDPETTDKQEAKTYTGVIVGFRNDYVPAEKTRYPGHRIRMLMYDPKDRDTIVRFELTTYGQGNKPTTAASMLVRTLADANNGFIANDLVTIAVKQAHNPETREATKGTTVFVSRRGGDTSIPSKPKDVQLEIEQFNKGVRILELKYPYPDLRTWIPEEIDYDQTVDEEYSQIPPDEAAAGTGFDSGPARMAGGPAGAPAGGAAGGPAGGRTQEGIPAGEMDPREDDLPF